MTTELWILLASCGLGLIHLTAASFSFKAQVGNAYTVGARDDAKQPVGIAARLHRAQWNFLETFPIFIALVVTLQLTQTYNDWSYWGAWLYILGRSLFLPLYALGVPWLRTLSWNGATLGLVLVGVGIWMGVS